MRDLDVELGRSLEDMVCAQFQSNFSLKVKVFCDQYNGLPKSVSGWEFLQAYSFLYNKIVGHLYGPSARRRHVRAVWVGLITDTAEGRLVQGA